MRRFRPLDYPRGHPYDGGHGRDVGGDHCPGPDDGFVTHANPLNDGSPDSNEGAGFDGHAASLTRAPLLCSPETAEAGSRPGEKARADRQGD